jgi:septal ring factor EnvC (AmiA/AmiB activator)
MRDTQIYIEQGCNIAEFEADVNKALKELCKTREVLSFQLETGIDHVDGGLNVNWYTATVEHGRKVSYEYERINDAIEKTNKKLVKLVTLLNKLESNVKENSDQISKIKKVNKEKKELLKKEKEKKELAREESRKESFLKTSKIDNGLGLLKKKRLGKKIAKGK